MYQLMGLAGGWSIPGGWEAQWVCGSLGGWGRLGGRVAYGGRAAGGVLYQGPEFISKIFQPIILIECSALPYLHNPKSDLICIESNRAIVHFCGHFILHF